MNDQRGSAELERRLSRSLHASAPVASPELANRLLRVTAAAGQRRGWLRTSLVMPALAASAVVVIAVLVGLGLGGLLPRTGSPPSSPPAESSTPAVSQPATVEPTASPGATAETTPSPSEVFPGGGRCTDEELGYSVAYPAGWFANDEVPADEGLDPVPACRYFGEGPMEITPNAGLPPTVAIGFSQQPQAPPPSDGATVLRDDETEVAGRPARVRETEGTGDGPFFGAGDRAYEYVISLPDGSVLQVSTTTDADGDYESHKAVLDAMMQTLELDGI